MILFARTIGKISYLLTFALFAFPCDGQVEIPDATLPIVSPLDCGVNCAKLMLELCLGDESPDIESVREGLPITPQKGTSLLQLYKYMQKFELSVEPKRVLFDDIDLLPGQYLLAHLNPGHYVVVFPTTSGLAVADPPILRNLSEIREAWSGKVLFCSRTAGSRRISAQDRSASFKSTKDRLFPIRVLNVGSLQQNAELLGEFVIENPYDRELQVLRVDRMHNGISISGFSRRIKPNSRGSIRFVLDAGPELGPIKQHIYVKFVQPIRETFELRVLAQVEANFIDKSRPFSEFVFHDAAGTLDLSQGDYFVSLLVASCGHCMESVAYLNELAVDADIPEVIGLVFADENRLEGFRETTLPVFRTYSIDEEVYHRFVDTAPPKFYLISNGISIESWDHDVPPTSSIPKSPYGSH